MNNLAAPFTSLLTHNASGSKMKPRALLLICLLICVMNTSMAQEVVTTQAPAQGDTRAGAASATGSITGRVVSEDGRPLPDALIFMTRAFARGPGSPLTATTDSEGKFRVTGLEAGLYVVNTRVPGYTTAESLTDVTKINYYRVGDSVNLTLVKGGVITGTVRDANGDPVVAVPVRAMRVRDGQGRPVTAQFSGFTPERMTDDRGVYRIYGLLPGAYVVSAGGSQRLIFTNGYDGDAPTFFPSSTRDTASEVPVRTGEEAPSIDIRYRGERGHTVSGTVSGFIETKTPSGVSITLRHAGSGGFEGTTFVMQNMKPSFAFNGVSDGVYEVAAQQWGGLGDSAASIPRRVTIKGADVTGLDLVLSPLASINGRVLLEAPPKESCDEGRGGTILETAIHARRDEKNQTEDTARLPFFSAGGDVPTDQGEFTIRNLIAGSYRLSLRLPSDAWYVRSISLPNAAATPPAAPTKSAQPKSAPVASSLITLQTGARFTNVIVQIAQDAASLRGRVTAPASEGAADAASLPANLRVYLVPVERERAEDVLRYSEAPMMSDGAFTFQNLAPGRYWLVARLAPESESIDRTPRPLAWDADTRAKLRREAETANNTIELKSCQRAANYELRYAPPAAKP